MIGGGSDDNEPEGRPSTRTTTTTPPSSPSPPPPIASPLQDAAGGVGLGRRLLGSIRALLPASPPKAKPKVGLCLLLHLRPDHPTFHPTPSASEVQDKVEGPLEEDNATGRDDRACSDADAGPPSPLSWYRLTDPAAASARPPNTMFRQWAAKQAPHLLHHFPKPAAEEDQDPSLALLLDEEGPFRVASEEEDGEPRPTTDDSSSASFESEAGDPVESTERLCAPEHEGPRLLPGNSPRDLHKDAAPASVRTNIVFGQRAAAAAAGDDQQHKVLQQCTAHQLRAAASDDDDGQEQEQVAAIHPGVETACCDIASAHDQHKVEGNPTNQCGPTEIDDDGTVEGQEVVDEDVVATKGEGADGTIADDQDKAVVQCDTHELGTTENDDDDDAEDDQEEVEQGAIHEGDAATDDDNIVINEGGTAIAVQDQDKGVDAIYDFENDDVVDDQLGAAWDDQEVVEQVAIHPRDETTCDIAVDAWDDQEVVEQVSIHPRDETTCDIAVDAWDDQEVVEQVSIHPRDETTCDIVVDAWDDQELVEQVGIHPRDETTCDIAVEDQKEVGSAENVDAGEGQEVVEQGVIGKKGDDIAVDDQDKAVQQCDTYELGTTENDDDFEDDHEAVEHDEGGMDDEDHEAVGQSVTSGIGLHATICLIAVQDQDKGVDATYDLGTVENDDVVDDQWVVEQNATHPMDDIAVDEQEKLEQEATPELGSPENVVEDQDAVDRKGEGTESAAAEDQEKTVEQCATHALGTTENDDAKDGEEAVEQCVIDEGGAAMDVYKAFKDHEVVRQSGMHAAIDGIAVQDQEKGVDTTYDLGTAENDDAVDDQEVVEQNATHPMDKIAVEEQDKSERHTTHELGSAENVDDVVEDQEVVKQDVIDTKGADTDGSAAEDQDKAVEQCATCGLGTTENDVAKDDQEEVEQGVVDKGTMDDDDSVEDHEVVEQSIIDGMHTATDDIAVEDQEKVVGQCTESRAITDEHTVEEKEKVVEQSIIDGLRAATDDIAVEDQEKVVGQCAVHESRATTDEYTVEEKEKVVEQGSDAITTNKDDDPVEEHNKVGNQGVIAENGRTKDDIVVEEHDYLKEQVIVDNWGTFCDATALEDQKNEAGLRNDAEQIASKDIYAVHMKDSMLEQRNGDKQGSRKSDFTVEKNKDVVERACHEWGEPDDDLAFDKTASQGIREISSSEAVSATVNGSDGRIWKEKVKLPYPQRPGKLNCPFYMSKGTCSYGFSCQFHHPPLKAKPDGSWRPSEQGNHGVAEILELNRIGLPLREGSKNCTYYMRNGACRYGKHCHFNHPEHVIDAQFYAPTGWEDSALQLEKSSDHHTTVDDTSHLKKSSDDATLDDTSYSKMSSDHATLDDTSYSKKSSDHVTLDDTSSSTGVLPPNIFRMLLPPQKVVPSTEAKVIQVKKGSNWSSTSDDSDGCCSADSSDGPLCKQEHVDYPERRPLCKQEHVDYPERPGRPECPFYTRFGDCKFASACKYHHSKDKYPERPGEPECPFYMKNQFCKFGAQCRFNHPKDSNPTTQGPMNAKKSVAANEYHQPTRITLEDHMPQQQQYPERPAQPDCRYYLQFGKCKFLSACIFHHPRDLLPSGPAHSDQIGPATHAMPDCPFYMKSGKCQFGSACEFHHPKDTTEGASGHRTGLSYDNSARPENAAQRQEESVYPERPGEPRCYNYMRHGSCRFQMKCKYHHPADRLSRKSDSTYH